MSRGFIVGLRIVLAAPLGLALAAAGPEDKPRQSDGMVVPGSGPGTSSAGGPANVGMTIAGSKTDAEARARLAPARFLSTDVIGITVRDNAGNKLGSIVDLVMEDGRSLSAVVLDLGGFLGVKSRYIAVQPASVILSPGGDRYAATVDMSKEQLGSLPDFDYRRYKPDK